MPEPGSPLVVVIGSVSIDHVVVAEAFPSPGQTILGRTAQVTLGGKGANQAVAAASGGARTAMIAQVGDDAEADKARAGLVAAGVDVHGVTTVPGAETGTAWITVAAGDNAIIVVSGANFQWPSEGDPIDGAGVEAAVVLAQLEIPLDVVQRAAAVCRGRFLLNAAPAAELPDELISRCDVLIVNEHEQAAVSGQSDGEYTKDPGAVRKAHAALRGRGAKAVVTTLGGAGAIITDTDGTRDHDMRGQKAVVADGRVVADVVASPQDRVAADSRGHHRVARRGAVVRTVGHRRGAHVRLPSCR